VADYFLILYTSLAPDIYVFVQQALIDNVTRSVEFSSLTSNNLIFDVLIVFGDWINISSSDGWVYLISTITLIVILVKYTLLASYSRPFGLILIFLSSIVIDINQLRFTLAIVLIMLAFNSKSFFSKTIFSVCSFISHIAPVLLYSASLLVRYKIYISGSFICLLALIMYYAQNYLIDFSRFFIYLSLGESYIPKILFVALPSFWYLYSLPRGQKLPPLFENLFNFSCFLLIFSIPFLFININLSARFVEIAYIFINILNSFKKINNFFDLLLLLLSLSIFISRVVSGVSGVDEFTDRYRLES
jgi:hypothetical protein